MFRRVADEFPEQVVAGVSLNTTHLTPSGTLKPGGLHFCKARNRGLLTRGRVEAMVLWTEWLPEEHMFKFLRKTALWIVAVPLLSLGLGAGLNQAVLIANHDKFPVIQNDAKVNLYRLAASKAADEGNEEAGVALVLLDHGYLDDTHVIMTHDTKLNWLADWIDVHYGTYSPGDLLIGLGERGNTYAPFIWAFVVAGKLRKREEREY